MKSYEVLSTVYDQVNKRIEVIKEITNDDATTYYDLHVFSASTLEWRAAEYGVQDPALLVEIVLNEPFIESTEHLNVSVEVAAELHTAKVQEASATLQVSNTTTKEEHKARMLQAGIDQKYIDAVDLDPFEAIQGFATLSARGIEVKRNYVDKLRADRMQEGVSGTIRPRQTTTVLRKNKKV